MAFTAAALAFALPGLDRPVVLTGAQRPLVALRSDARRNLADAVELATHDIPEVGICFDGLLLRGTRAVKADARTYHAFESPGVEPLARLGLDVDVGAHVRRPAVPFRCDPRFDDRVAVVYVTPGLDPAWIEGLLAAPAPRRGPRRRAGSWSPRSAWGRCRRGRARSRRWCAPPSTPASTWWW